MRQHEEGHVEEGGAQERVLDRLALTLLAKHVEPHHGPQERIQLPIGRGHGEKEVEAVALDHLAYGAEEALHRLGLRAVGELEGLQDGAHFVARLACVEDGCWTMENWNESGFVLLYHLCRDSHIPDGAADDSLWDAVGRRLRWHRRVPPRSLPLLEDVVGLCVREEFGGAPGAHTEEDLDHVAAAPDVHRVEEGTVVGEQPIERLVCVCRCPG